MENDKYYPIGIFQTRRRVDVPTWACSTRYMESTSGMMSYDATPFLELPAHYMSDIAGTGCVVLKTPAQIGKTTAIENFLGWICEFDRANTMIVLDTLKSGQNMSKNRIRPFLRNTCGINNPDSSGNKNPDRSNAVCNIGLGRGANLLIASAKSASDLRSTPCKYMLMDELDAWPDELKGEGDPVQLALGRMLRFRGMCVMTSTPTSYEGRIMQQFMSGTRQTWGVYCKCGQFMQCRWDSIDWSNDIPIVHCDNCGCVFSEQDVKNLTHGYNEPQNEKAYKDEYGRLWRSFEVFGTLCHSFYTWNGLKRDEIRALSLGDATYQSFRNTKLGEVLKPRDEIMIDWAELMKVTYTPYKSNELPSDIAFIVMGIDTHDSCLYCETAGFSEDLKSIYGVDYRVLPGDPDYEDVWKMLDELMSIVYKTSDKRKLRPAFAFCDSGGHRTNAVYKYSLSNRRFLPIKGFATSAKNAQDPLVGNQQKVRMNGGFKIKCRLQYVGVNAGKDALLNMEILSVTGDKRLHYPNGCGYDDEYFKGLLSEKRVNGKWIQPYGKCRNEPLDTRVYAMAAAEYYNTRFYKTGMDLELQERMENKEEIKDEIPKNIPENSIDKKESNKPLDGLVSINQIKNLPHW